jgi:hypothetical protein
MYGMYAVRKRNVGLQENVLRSKKGRDKQKECMLDLVQKESKRKRKIVRELCKILSS